MGGLRYFLEICLVILLLTGCAPVNTLSLYSEGISFFDFLVWLFLLGLPFLVIIKLSCSGCTIEQKKQNLTSAWAGIFAGIAVFVIHLVWFPGKPLGDPKSVLPSVEIILSTLIGLIIGFISLFVLRMLASCWRLAGFFNFMIVAIILIIAVYSTESPSQSITRALISGIGLGICIHITLIPDTVTKFFK